MLRSNGQKNAPESQLIAVFCALMFGIMVERQCAGEGNVVTAVKRTHSAHVRGRRGF